MFNEMEKLRSDMPSQAIMGGISRRQTQREQLIDRKNILSEQLRKVENALTVLDKYPDFEEAMNAVIAANF